MMALNTTIADAEAAAAVEAVKPKFVSPEVFQPAKSSPQAFLRNFERCAIANGWQDVHKIRYLGSFLEGAANTWYTEYRTDEENAQKTWSDVKDAFMRVFHGGQAQAVLRRALRAHRQAESQDILEYYYELLRKLEEYNPRFTDEDLQAYFEDGLHERYAGAYYVMQEESLTREQLRDIVYKLVKQPGANVREDRVLYMGDGNGGSSSHRSSVTTSTPWSWDENRRTADGQGQSICSVCTQWNSRTVQ